MTRNLTLSLAVAALLTAGNAFAFGSSCGLQNFHKSHKTHKTHKDHKDRKSHTNHKKHGNFGSHFGFGGSCGFGGGFDWGAGLDGFYVCLNGSSPLVSGSFSGSFLTGGDACDNNAFDFTYRVSGGFVKDSAHADSPNMKVGQDDQTQDGFWYREGPFSSPVAYGDVNNDGKRYPDTPDAYPAWTWGHPEADPFISEGGEGDNLGGAAGIGSAGFTGGINAGDDGFFFPYNFFEVNNKVNSFVGAYSSELIWNVKLYDKSGNKVYEHTFTNTLYYWETLNVAIPNLGIECPRDAVQAGETINDTVFNKDIHDNVLSFWPTYGQGIDYVGDGQTDAKNCADPVTLKNKVVSDTFSIGTYFQRTYKVTLEGPYIYDSGVDGCSEVDEKGLPDTDGTWDAKCFKKVDTIWVDEDTKARAFMRLNVEKEKKKWF